MAKREFKRPHMSLTVKLKALLINGPVLDENKKKVCDLELIEWDHHPPLALRPIDEETGDTIPPANDPKYIHPMYKPAHREKTAKQDIPQIAKANAQEKKLGAEEFRAILLRPCGQKRKTTGKIKSQGFDKGRKRDAGRKRRSNC